MLSEETVLYHYGKHERAYVDNLNKLIQGTPYETMPLEEIVRSSDGAIFNNAAQAWNHQFYFFAFSPDGKIAPTGELRWMRLRKNLKRQECRCLVRVGYGCRKMLPANCRLRKAEMQKLL